MTGRSARSGARPTRRTAAFAAAAAAAAAVVLAVVVGTTIVRSAGGAPDGVVTVTEPQVVHVHGLGVDPADGTLFAATHGGLFRLPEDGPAVRVADRYQDTMGFTVIGAGNFLGSGHPDLREMREQGLPPLLGLIESTDAGVTWQARSLDGEADFHGLVAAHDRIYGYDATGERFMVSEDGRRWETRSRRALSSFAVDPEEPDRVVAADGRTTSVSTDGGRTWAPTAAPAMAVLSWDPAGTLWGAGADGGVWERDVDGGRWVQRGEVAGEPEALLAGGSRLYIATGEAGILVSDDGARTWSVRYREDRR